MERKSEGPGFTRARTQGAAHRLSRLTRWLLPALLASSLVAAVAECDAAPLAAGSAAALRLEYSAASDRLAASPFQRPLQLESQERTSELRGDVRAVVDHPFAMVSSALVDPAHWCDILILHLNVKYCRASETTRGALAVEIGRKSGETLDASRRIALTHRVVAYGPEYVQVVLAAERGPFSTSNYTIMLESMPLEGGKSFVHLSYSHALGLRARLAMRAYFNTLGAGKVGFSVVATDAAGNPVYVNDLRGALERNAMRFYLAVDAYLNAMAAPPEEQADRRMREWFAATERFPLQLRELDQAEYLAMKREEYQRQQIEP